MKQFFKYCWLLIIFSFFQLSNQCLYAQCDPHGGDQKEPKQGDPGIDWDLGVLGSGDPNQLISPAGYNTPRFVSVKDNMGFTILFENDPKIATSPAQKVIINYPIHNNQELSSFRVGAYGFNGQVFTVPVNRSFFATQLDLRDSLGIFVNVTAGIDVINNRAFWIFESIDTVTGLPPTDPLAGLLAVADSGSSSGKGHGFVSFSMIPKSNAQTRDTIFATADIVFDQNDTLPTNVEFNTIDAVAPSSHISATSLNGNLITLQFNAADDINGSGVKNYDLFVAQDSANYDAFATASTDTVIQFTGVPGATYHFFSLANDNTGNREQLKLRPDTSVHIPGLTSTLAINCVTNKTRNTNVGVCTYTASGTEFDPSVSNGGNSFVISNSYNQLATLAGAHFPKGATTVLWTATDASNNTVSCSFTVTVIDSVPPAITCPANVTINCPASTAPANTGTATAQDNCSATVAFTDVTTPGNCPGNYTITRTWTATDSSSNQSSCTQIITVQDTTAPVITCPANTTVSCTADHTPAGTGNATATHGCSGATVTYADVTTAGNCPSSYTIERTWTATDSCGNHSSCVQTITVQDMTGPTMTCPANITVSCTADHTPAGTGSATATDGCSSAIVTYTDVTTTGNCPGNYSIARTWTATDACGNHSSCVQTITVHDLAGPTIICPANATVSCTADHTPAGTGSATATDGCSGAIVTHTDVTTAGNCPGNYTIARTWTATDSCGNHSSCIQIITVHDLTAPTIACPANTTVACTADHSPAGTGSATASDGCGSATITYADVTTAGNCPGNYIIARTWTATDACGNHSSCVQTITVQDMTSPTMTCPVNITVSCTADHTPAGTGSATASDGCGIATITYADVTTAGNCPGNYTIARTWIATDACGNHSSCVQTITVHDLAGPTIICPANATVSCTADHTPAGTGTATATDGCSSAIVTYTDVTTAGNCPGNYTIARTWTATDACGNHSSCTQTITVQDLAGPTISCPANTTVSCMADHTPAGTGNATASDSCSGATITYADVTTAENCAGNYTITRTWTATDACGNAATCVQIITVRDQTAPTAVCRNVTVNLVNGSATLIAAQVNNGSFDNCSGIMSMTLSKTTFSCGDIGNNTVTLTVTDACGNSSTCNATVTVVGVRPGCLTTVTPSNTTYTGGIPTNIYLGYGPQTATISAVASGGSSFSYSWSPATNLSCSSCANPVFTPLQGGTYTRTVTVSGSSGCTTSCTVTFCVKDIRVPGNGNNDKVYICHVPSSNPTNTNTLSISTNVVSTHLGNHSGDHLGTCDQICGAGARMLPGNGNVLGEEVKVYPNPNSGTFTVELPYIEDQALITVSDIAGKTIQKSIVKDGDGNKIQLELGTVASGMYLIEVAWGDKRFRAKLIIQ